MPAVLFHQSPTVDGMGGVNDSRGVLRMSISGQEHGLVAHETSMITAIFAVAATVAATSVTASSLLSTPTSYPLTTGPDVQELAAWTANPIRTVVTVNSNPIDVLAAAEEDVPKVLEKLRELCAGPYAHKYPEICEYLGGEELWWPTAVPSTSPSILSYISTPQSSSIAAKPTLSVPTTTSSLPTPTSSPPIPTSSLALPTSSLDSSTATANSSTSPADSELSAVVATRLIAPVVPTSVSVAASTITSSPSTLELTVTQSIYRFHLTAPSAEMVECPYSSSAEGENDETKALCSVTTIHHHLPISTLITVTGPVLSFPRNGAPVTTMEEPARTTTLLRTRIRFTRIKTIDTELLNDDEDDAPLPSASVQFVSSYSPTLEVDTAPSTPTAGFEPELPTAVLPSSTNRPGWIGYRPFPSISWFRSADSPGGCTQTETIFSKMTGFQTATVFAATARATRVVACECPNFKVVLVGGPGVVIEARTTVTVGEVRTETGLECSTVVRGGGPER
ncbi:hypothetical protein QC764_302290 [Podospora pseudoanserina]|uniref:Uncharacterized protein n=1 Tax=Podospora pseudoanserina TaxID=2609844 RepID=A0ABR0ICG6_9PEZI|nr:hypothetical protein QC764_302290 [Podospora pseudoanserina]